MGHPGHHHAQVAPEPVSECFEELGESARAVAELVGVPDIFKVVKGDFDEFLEVLVVEGVNVEPLVFDLFVAFSEVLCFLPGLRVGSPFGG